MKQLFYRRSLLLFWLTAIPFADSLIGHTEAGSMPPVVSDRFDGRALILTLGGSRYYLESPAASSVVDVLSQNPKISLVHSGYTAADPDGKSALLTLTLQVAKGILS